MTGPQVSTQQAEQVVRSDEALSERDAAVAEVHRWEAEAERWQARGEIAEADLERLEQSSGRMLLDEDDAALERVAAEQSSLRSQLALARKAAAEARDRAEPARRAVVLAEAAELDGLIRQARAALAAHEAKTAKLLDALQEHTGAQYRQVTLDILADEAELAGRRSGVSIGQPAVEPLRREVSRLERRQQALRAAGEGLSVRQQLPDFSYGELPESLRPGSGILPQPGFASPPPAHDYAAEADALEEQVREQQAVVDRTLAGRSSDDPATRYHAERVDLRAEERQLAQLQSRMWTARGRAGQL